ncbi:hypothetical protein NHX12_006045 [Muraenolepis orangiensis]|uniref:Uncharacterized protein n=1 Tax=Muraenolepis orangiensis TaxID=630683 RepID=A0A9Q0IE87_9TELE|nr:hypothetical protein NHX12_006045 [Muraenolepis orangiensis]
MPVRRAVVDAAVLHVQDGRVVYPSCRTCCSRIDLQPHDHTRYECSKCGYSCPRAQVGYRYRLSLRVARDTSIFGVTVFGSCLDPFFGLHASGLQRLMEEDEEPVEAATRAALLQQAVEDCFIGRHFIFRIKVNHTGSGPWFDSDGGVTGACTATGSTHFISTQVLLPPGGGGAGCPVVLYYRALLQRALGSLRAGCGLMDTAGPRPTAADTQRALPTAPPLANKERGFSVGHSFKRSPDALAEGWPRDTVDGWEDDDELVFSESLEAFMAGQENGVSESGTTDPAPCHSNGHGRSPLSSRSRRRTLADVGNTTPEWAGRVIEAPRHSGPSCPASGGPTGARRFSPDPGSARDRAVVDVYNCSADLFGDPVDDIIVHPLDFIPPLQSTPLLRMHVPTTGSGSAAVHWSAAPGTITTTPCRAPSHRFHAGPLHSPGTRPYPKRDPVASGQTRKNHGQNLKLTSRRSSVVSQHSALSASITGPPGSDVGPLGPSSEQLSLAITITAPVVTSGTQEVSEHAAFLMTNLNILRCRALFCDCVVRGGGDSAHLYPAHRCVLAASSPVFAALLPSSGALLELHDPRLPAAVLAHVLDYIYTGVVPSLGGLQLFYSLLGAAEYLQMDGLLGALRAGTAEDWGLHMRAGHRFYSDDKFGKTPPVTPRHTWSDPYAANAEDYEESHHHETHATNQISCIKQLEVNVASSTGDGHSNAKSDLCPRPEHTRCTVDVNSRDHLIRAEEQEQSWRSQEPEPATGHRIPSTMEQRRNLRYREQQRSRRSRDQKKRNLRTRVNTKKPLCLSLLTTNNVCGSPVRWTAEVSTSSPAPLDTTLVNLHNKSPPPLPHRSLSVSSCKSGGAVPVIHHSSEVLPHSFLPVGYTRPASRTTCCQPGSTAAAEEEEEERTPQSNDTENTDDGRPAAEIWTSENPKEDPPEVQEHNVLDYVTENGEVYEGNMAGFKDCLVRCGISHTDHHEDHEEGRREQPEDGLQSGGQKVSRVATVAGGRVTLGGADASRPVAGRSPESENHHGNPFPRWEGDRKGEGSHDNQDDGIYSLQSTFDFVKGSLSTSDQPEERSRSFSDQPDKEKKPPGSRPLQEIEIRSRPQISSTPPVDKTSHHTHDNTEERTYLGHLRYHYLPSERSHLTETHLDQADQTRPPSDPNQSPKGEGRFYSREPPSAKLLFLDISSKSVQLQVFHHNRVREKGTGYGAAEGESGEGWGAEAGPQDPTEEPCAVLRVPPGIELNPRHATEKWCNVDMCGEETRRTGTGQEIRGVAALKFKEQGYHPATALTPLTSPWPCAPAWSPETQQLYRCSLCERSFSQRGSLNRHVRSHLGVRPYLCPRCPMTFSRQYRVTEHMRVHERCVLREDHLKASRPSTES